RLHETENCEGGGGHGHGRYERFRRSPQPQHCWHAFHRLLLSQRSHHPCLKKRRRLNHSLRAILHHYCRKPSRFVSVATRHALQHMRAHFLQITLRKRRDRSVVQYLSDVLVFHLDHHLFSVGTCSLTFITQQLLHRLTNFF